MSSIWGRHFTIDIFGESHGKQIGVVLNGVPAGVQLDLDAIQAFLDRRRAGSESWSTKRRESDVFDIVSGFVDGHTTGTPLCALCANTNARSGDYAARQSRPGHADYTGHVRYGGHNDHRGGGHFSGRLTAPLVFAGAVASQILAEKGVYAACHILKIADVHDSGFDMAHITKQQLDRLRTMRFPLIDESRRTDMEQRIKAAMADADSVGGVIEGAVIGMPPGVGSPMFRSVESVLSSMLFSVPAVKGVSFGAGFGFADMRGSAANDPYALEAGRVITTTNNNGGILGGITTGMPVVFQAVIKPTASIGQPQNTVNLGTNQPEMITIQGRHDPCIVPRAAAAIEAAACVCMLDIMMERGTYHGI